MGSTKRRFKVSKDPEFELSVPLPPAKGLFTEYDEIYFHLTQAPRLSTALRETYGEVSFYSEYELFKFLAETTDQSYINWVGEQLFSQQASAALTAELLSLCDKHETTILGCIFFASLLPKYCERFTRRRGTASKFCRDENEIIQSFLADIKSLRYPGGYWQLIIMRKYTELYQTLHGEEPKDLHLLWKEEDEMIDLAEAKSNARLRKSFRLDICSFCDDVVFDETGMKCLCEYREMIASISR
jgi:hypothetical protein